MEKKAPAREGHLLCNSSPFHEKKNGCCNCGKPCKGKCECEECSSCEMGCFGNMR